VHVASASFRTAVARSLSAVPSRVALLVPANDTSPVDILVRYLDSAGLNFAGAAATTTNHGLIYDKLYESDFLSDWDHSALKSRRVPAALVAALGRRHDEYARPARHHRRLRQRRERPVRRVRRHRHAGRVLRHLGQRKKDTCQDRTRPAS